MSPTPSPSIGFTAPVGRMDSSQFGGKGQGANIPPLMAATTNGQLMYGDSHSPIKIDIQGTIDKGFFLSDGEWTCYRRNYFSCICSYSLSPYYPTSTMQYIPSGSSQTYQVLGFAMCIAAVVAESDSHMIELVQHTPKRDKGPVQRPEKVRLLPKTPQPVGHHPLGLYTNPHDMASGSRSLYDNTSYAQSGQNAFPTEHTFERIQFKQATANNGKRRAAQQYYHLLVELYADVGNQAPDGFIKIAQRKSAKMIVRGRSPGHYQTDRRGSTGSGPGGSSGMGGYSGSSGMGEYGSGGSSLLQGSYGVGGGYDPRASHYNATRHHELPTEPVMPADESKAIDNTKDYQYYPAPIYEGSAPRHGITMFSDRSEHDGLIASTTTAEPGASSRSVKHEYDTLPSIVYQPGPAYYSAGGCSRFEGKPSSAGYYPIPQSG